MIGMNTVYIIFVEGGSITGEKVLTLHRQDCNCGALAYMSCLQLNNCLGFDSRLGHSSRIEYAILSECEFKWQDLLIKYLGLHYYQGKACWCSTRTPCFINAADQVSACM